MDTYVRFETPFHCESSSQPLGIFCAASYLRDRDLEDWTREWLEDSLLWFNENLPVPAHSTVDERAIFWFRPKSPMVREIWQLVAVMHEGAMPIRLRRTKIPGRIIYHDRFQIAAIPYGSGRRRRKKA